MRAPNELQNFEIQVYRFFQTIQEVLADANEHGVILFSFGGNIRSADMGDETIQMFYNVFSKLKQKVFWKWESSEIPAGKPNNVHMLQWLPQVDLLAQPQVRFFISHCGIGSVYEAKFHGVPILGIVSSHFSWNCLQPLLFLQQNVFFLFFFHQNVCLLFFVQSEVVIFFFK